MEIKTQKIDGIILDTYKMLITAFLITDKANLEKFFKKTFLIANISSKVVFGILFFILSHINVDFLD